MTKHFLELPKRLWEWKYREKVREDERLAKRIEVLRARIAANNALIDLVTKPKNTRGDYL